MLIFGEKINTINPDVAKALYNKDKSYFENLVKLQIDTGIVDVIDINVGSDATVEPDNMKWAVGFIEDLIGDRAAISIDSANPDTIIAGINQLRTKEGAFLNSVTLEKKRYEKLLPLAREYNLNIIALPIDSKGIPPTAKGRLELASKLADLADSYGIDINKLFIDCIVQPISLSTDNAIISLETIRQVKKNIPYVKTFICLTAISFGLPDRKLLNRVFLSLLVKEGIDSVILDPLDKELIDELYSANVLTGRDEFCRGYINYIKNR